MLQYRNRGHVVEIKLPEECGHAGYSVECRYRYIKSKEKYLLSMWLKRDDIGDLFKIEAQEIDTQLISGKRETIRQNICRIVEQASLSGFFEYFINRYEYTCRCFDIGNEVLEKEAINNAS